MDACDKVAELYPFDGTDPGVIIALRSAFRAGVDWYVEGIDGGTVSARRTPLWCADDTPHSEHWAYNEFRGRDYCSGRPAPQPTDQGST